MVPPARTFGSAQPAGLCTAGPAGGAVSGRGEGRRRAASGAPVSPPGYCATTRSRICCTPERSGNGYRTYSESAVYRVQQIRGLLDSGLTTEIIRTILPYLNSPDEIHVHPTA